MFRWLCSMLVDDAYAQYSAKYD